MKGASDEVGVLITTQSDVTFLGPFINKIGASVCKIIYDDREKGISLYGNDLDAIKRMLPTEISPKNFIKLSEAITYNKKIDLLISIHPYIIHDFLSIAKKNIRLSYSISKYSWQFGEINKYYDLIFTQGPYSSLMIKLNFGLPCMEVGYPRYLNFDRTVKHPLIDSLVHKNLPIITFFPAIGSKSIQILEKAIIARNDKFTFVIKVHPIEEDELVNYYESLHGSFVIIFEKDEKTVTNELIIMNSDLIIHDVGGTCFSSLYFEKNFAFIKRRIDKLNVLKKSPEDLLYDLVNRTIDPQNFITDVEKFLNFPLKYGEKTKKIKKLFFAKNPNEKFIRSINFILNFKKKALFWNSSNKLSRNLRRVFYRIYSLKFVCQIIVLKRYN